MFCFILRLKLTSASSGMASFSSFVHSRLDGKLACSFTINSDSQFQATRGLLHGKKRWRLPCSGVDRSQNPRFSNCFAVGEFVYSFHYPVFSHYGESWKTPVLFAGVHRCFPGVKLHVHPGFTIENRHFPLFSRTENAVKFCKTHCLPEFTTRLTNGQHGAFPRSQKFSVLGYSGLVTFFFPVFILHLPPRES